MSRSVVEYFGRSEDPSCGYCKASSSNGHRDSYGMWAHRMTAQDYQDLIDRGWRRSGKYVYKMCNENTCCPQYTIRHRALEFRTSKTQKKCIKRLNRFLISGTRHSGRKAEYLADEVSAMRASQVLTKSPDWYSLCATLCFVAPEVKKAPEIPKVQDPKANPSDVAPVLQVHDTPSSSGSKQKSAKGAATKVKCSEEVSAPKCAEMAVDGTVAGDGIVKSHAQEVKVQQRGKDRRRAKKLERLRKKGIDPAQNHVCKKKSVEELLNEPDNHQNPAHRLELRLVKQGTEQWKSSYKASYKVYKAYQMKIHGDPPHKCAEDNFVNFLVDNPFPEDEESPFGAFHWQFWLDGRLVAVSVIDILPHCISSKYFYYHPAFSFLNLGTYSALREIALVRELQRRHAELRYLYMGFYVHDCTKMRYKAQYYPSEILCPVTMSWVSSDIAIRKLDTAKYMRLQDDTAVEDEDAKYDASNIGILFMRHAVTLSDYVILQTQLAEDELDRLQDYARVVGRKAGPRMLLFRT